MLRKITRSGKLSRFAFIVPLFALILGLGCDSRYYDDRLKMEVQQLDSDLKNRWATSGVVVLDTTPNGPRVRHNSKLANSSLTSLWNIQSKVLGTLTAR